MITPQELANIQAGLYGVDVITDTAAHAPANGVAYGYFVALTDVVVAAIASQHLGGNTMAGVTISKTAQVWIPRVTTITLTSGSLAAYRMPQKAY